MIVHNPDMGAGTYIIGATNALISGLFVVQMWVRSLVQICLRRSAPLCLTVTLLSIRPRDIKVGLFIKLGLL
jgi:hypothetical protein